METTHDTICAISSPPGTGAVGIIRISGPRAIDILDKIFKSNQPFHTAMMRHGFIHKAGEIVDEVMAVGFLGEATYTGEPTAEIFPHGGRVPMMAVLDAVMATGARMAEPGEFTKRAFLNGKMDLSEAEAVMDFIGAVSKSSAKAAFNQLEGQLSQKIYKMQDELTNIIAAIEAGIEYPEEDLEHNIKAQVYPKIEVLIKEGDVLAASFDSGKYLKEGFNVCIIGKPNVGKSSLLNALIGKEKAIVTEIEGTTRDVIEELYDIGGVPVRYFDTAGIRQSTDVVESIGVDRSLQSIEKADLVLFVVDGSEPRNQKDEDVYQRIKHKEVVLVRNKLDKGKGKAAFDIKPTVETSAVDGVGLDALEEIIFHFAVKGQDAAESIIITNQRHKEILGDYVNSLRGAISAFDMDVDLDCISIDITDAWQALGKITGVNVSEAVIDRIFENFCLGK